MSYDFYPKLLGARKLTLIYVLTCVLEVSLETIMYMDTE
jgi:hypothetical protein